MEPNQQPQDPQTPPVDVEAIKREAQENAERAANERIERMKEDLANSISGKSSYEAPKTWQEMEERVTTRSEERAKAIVDEQVKAALKARDDADAARTKQTLEQTEAQQKAEWEQNSREWSEAVQDGIIPDIAPAIKEKLKVDPDYSHLSAEEQNDPSLKAFNQGQLLHAQLKREGKSTSFYRTLQKFWNKMPAGAFAPVIGGSTATPPPSEELTYEQVQANRKAKLGF